MIIALDGSRVFAETLTRIHCSKCGVVDTKWVPNERELAQEMTRHIGEKH